MYTPMGYAGGMVLGSGICQRPIVEAKGMLATWYRVPKYAGNWDFGPLVDRVSPLQRQEHLELGLLRSLEISHLDVAAEFAGDERSLV